MQWWCWSAWEFFNVFNISDQISTWELEVDNTVHGEDNLEEKTREDADIRIYHISWRLFDRTWYAVMMLVDMRVFNVFNMSDQISTWELEVNNTVHGEDNLEEKTRKDAEIRINFLGLNLFNKDVIYYGDGGGHESFLCFQHEWPQVLVSWWSKALWTGLITSRRRPGRLLTLGCVPLVVFFFIDDVICCGDGGRCGHQSFLYFQLVWKH